MKKGGAIIDTFRSVYRNLGDVCKLRVGGNPPLGKIIKGPGAGDGDDYCRIDFIQMSKDADMESIRGAAFTLAIIEEALPDFTQEQIEMILARTRSNSDTGQEHPLGCKVLITGNPDPDHFLCELIKDFYLDENGDPIKERCGVLRYFYKFEGDYLWGDSKEEVYEKAESLGAYTHETVPLTKTERIARIMSFSFVQLTAKDNPIGLKNNPGYMAKLEAMDPIKKARNLYGNWFIREEESSFFKREWLRGVNGERVKRVSDIPLGCTAMRAVDCAHTQPHEGNLDPDFTAISPLILKDRDGFYWILGNYDNSLIDQPVRRSEVPVIGRVRRLAGERNNLIAKQGRMDVELSRVYKYAKPKMVAAKDNGGGASDFMSLMARLTEEGVSVLQDTTPSNVPGKKVKDFLGFAEAAQNGLINIVEDTFPPDTLEEYYKELEKFTGKKSTRKIHDDWVDATSLCFNNLRDSKRPYKTLITNQQSVPTLSAGLLQRDY